MFDKTVTFRWGGGGRDSIYSYADGKLFQWELKTT